MRNASDFLKRKLLVLHPNLISIHNFRESCGYNGGSQTDNSPILVVSSELDHLTPPAIGRSLATFYGADYRYLRGRGHNVLLEPNWRETASMVAAWLAHETRIGAA
jgi:hypothetical protein